MSIRRIAAGVFVAGTAAFLPATAGAETITEQGVTETFADYVPCANDPEVTPLEGWEITTTTNTIEHGSSNKNGEHATFTETGSFHAEPVYLLDADNDGFPEFDEETESFTVAGPRDGVTYDGHFTIWGGFNGNKSNANGTFTFSGNGTGDDDSTVSWHFVSHFAEDDSPPKFVEWEKGHC